MSITLTQCIKTNGILCQSITINDVQKFCFGFVSHNMTAEVTLHPGVKHLQSYSTLYGYKVTYTPLNLCECHSLQWTHTQLMNDNLND